MASTISADPAASTQLLDHPWDQADQARHRVPRQTRTGSPLLGVTATMAATFGAAGLTAAAAGPAAAAEPAVAAPDDSAQSAADPGLALAARIQQQADTRRAAAEETARLAVAQEAEARRAAAAAATAAPAPAAADTRAAAESAPADFAAPLAAFTLGTPYGPGGAYWASLHTGLDFEAPVGTPVTAVASGPVTSAGWAGSYGYRVVQTLPDGTEIWYCHLARLAATSGPATPATVLGAVGATGSVTRPRLHLEVRPGGGAPIDPQSWLRDRGVQV
ncbi:M23 family metallopeptidase [Kitasatospora paranensis]|uniref:M23 family metallopeptidase n=1 Tax=Kitasatospora paranensis TaxID=258053 RepID=A0ABW2G4E0_9ACTN